jgi:uncharacterized membrane protein YedE/YeeE
MMADHSPTKTALSGLAFVLVPLVVAFATRIWVLTAMPIGFLFGFFLQKGDLCGASAFSEIILARDLRKVFGIWVCIVVSMVAFAVGDVLGWVHLNPKPMIWTNFLVGGAIFGVGTVLAGGCVSGCLYKAAAGSINSIAAIVAMPAGIALVEYGPVREVFDAMKAIRLSGADGGALTLSSVTGVPYWLLAVILAGATLLVALARHRSRPTVAAKPQAASHWLMHPWKPWHAGMAIGLLALFAYMSSAASGRNYPLGVTHGVLQIQTLLADTNLYHVYEKPAPTPSSPAVVKHEGKKKIVWWLVLLVPSLMIGSFVAARLSGQAKLLPKRPEETLVALLGGFLVGVGAALATGCVVGNILSGWALLSIGSMVFGVTALAANWATTYVYLMGAPRR